MQSIQLATLDVDGLRTRLRKISDEELRKFAAAARYMVSPTANMGRPPLPDFVLQLEEARVEWRRRYKARTLTCARPADVICEPKGCRDSGVCRRWGCKVGSVAAVLG
jgi:hypothetical protein